MPLSAPSRGIDLPLQDRRLSLKLGMSAMRSYDYELSRVLLDILEETPGVTVYGITDRKRLEERVPTCAFTLSVGAGLQTRPVPRRQVAEQLDEANIYVWDGNYYALAVTERLGLEDSGGMLRVGPVHVNQVSSFWRAVPAIWGTLEEIKRFGDALGNNTSPE